MKFIILATFIFSASITNAQKIKSKSTVNSLLSYNDVVNNFLFKYPNNWTIRVADTSEKAKVFIRSPKENVCDPFIENINIIKKQMNVESFDVKSLKTSLASTLQKSQNNFELVKESVIKSNGVDALVIEYTMTKLSNSEQINIHMMQQILFKNKYLYTITYTAMKSAPKVFYDNAVAIFNSFTITK